MPIDYLQNLVERVRQGLGQVPAEMLDNHRRYVIDNQNEDGGFSGREGSSDLYYTGFAIRCLDCLLPWEKSVLTGLTSFLRQQLQESANIVDFVSLLYGVQLVESRSNERIIHQSREAWVEEVGRALERFRRPDGGYGKTVIGSATASGGSSTYHTFLVALCYQMIGQMIPEADRVIEFLLSRRRDDGGFVEIAPMKRSGTNPTAAAIGTLIGFEACSDEVASDAAEFFVRMQSEEGGLRANGRAPMADLLSTFTGVLSMTDLDVANWLDLQSVQQFTEGMMEVNGGFRGGLWDNETDVEYTFYGLGILSMV